MGCGEFLVKYILFFANLIFALAGITLLGLGIAVQLQIKEIVDIADANFQAAPITCIVVGSIVFFIAFLGCCGAVRESNCMLVSYAICMLVLMVIKITLAILIFVKLDNVLDAIPRWLSEAFTKNPTGFQEIEKTFQCCGPNGAASYMSPILPDSCCAITPCTDINANPACNTIIKDFFNTFGLAIGVVAIIIVAIELVSAVFGLCLANHVRNKSRRSRY